MKKNSQSTNSEILAAIDQSAQNLETKFTAAIDQSAQNLETKFTEANDEILSTINKFADHVEERFNKVEGRLDKVEGGLQQVKSQMTTKDYLDEKLVDLRGDLVVLVRKEDTKVKVLVETLQEKKILNDADAKKITGIEPFAQMIL